MAAISLAVAIRDFQRGLTLSPFDEGSLLIG